MPLVSKEASAPAPAGGTATLVAPAAVRTGRPEPTPVRSRGELPTSWEVSEFAVPTGREESWRFTPVGRLAALFADEPATAELGWSAVVPDGVTISDVSRAQVRDLDVPAPADRAAVVAAAQAGTARRIDIPASLELTDPIRVDLVGESASGQARGHVLITAGPMSSATVVLAHTGASSYGQVVSILAGPGAQLTVVTVADWEDGAVHLAEHDVVIGRDATVRHIAVTLGGSIVRVATNATYAGPGGSFEGIGLYFADAGQHQEHRLFVDHEAPHCRSDVVYRGALQGEGAHAVWIGDVLIRAAAEGTHTYEINRNLLLSDGARADSVPNLEIETGEILGAGHASTTGRFDDEQLFYLQSRGLTEADARRLVVHAFFAELVGRIGVADLAESIMAAIDAELAGTMAGGA
ncbi:MAG: Fe-S cluster assembly protein SufD [Austwickia sp.]|jgi:Fe-S cluster assembly protein SufD|nr:Fe-S cluster assembly protein SufD [Austwickia sp.]MBK9101060.1 Fe-S cluster assembly protein SufD [Austwickia sp.]